MKYFEKAIETYGKWLKALTPLHWRREVLEFNMAINRMTADGKCPKSNSPYYVSCDFCPLRLANESEENLDVDCEKIKPESVRHIIAMEVKQ